MSVPKRRKTSELWNFFTSISNEVASCNMCKAQLSYKSTTSNLKKHVELKHPTVAIPGNSKMKTMHSTQCPEEPVDNLEGCQQASTSATAVAGSSSHETIGQSRAENNTSCPTLSVNTLNKSLTQCRLTPYLPKKLNDKNKKTIDSKLMKLFTLDFQPFRIVEDPGFKDFVHALNPSYNLPSRYTISKTSIPAMYEECFNKAKAIVNTGKTFTITTDCWTSINNTSYIGVTAHFVNENFELTSVLLECSAMPSEHTSQNLSMEISRILNEWGIENKVILSVSDNASNIKNALKNIMGLKNFGCFAHTINLIVNDALKVQAVEELVSKIKTIVSYFRRSSVANQKLMACQKNQEFAPPIPLKLIQDVCTRWNSTFYMVERFIKLETSIRSTVALIDKDLPVLIPEDWKLAQQLCKVLKPFESVTKTISGEQYCTASLVIPLVSGLENVVEQMSHKDYVAPVKEVVTKVKNGLNTRCSSYENSQTLQVSTFLDPRFKNLAFKNKASADSAQRLVQNALTQKMRQAQASVEANPANQDPEEQGDDSNDEEFEIWSTYKKTITNMKPKGPQLSRAIIEVQRYLEEDVPERKVQALNWWKENHALFPNLSVLAKEKLCTLATSVPCERLFSKAGLLLTDRRNRLSENKTKILLFLNINSKLLSE